jgi:hypothetical protein
LLLVEDPLAGMPSAASEPFARLLAQTLARRKTAYFAARVGLRSPVAQASDEAIVIEGSHVGAQGTVGDIAARVRSFSMHFTGDVSALIEALRRRGAHISACTQWARHARVSVDLGELATRDVLRLAQEYGAVVLELRPLARALA